MAARALALRPGARRARPWPPSLARPLEPGAQACVALAAHRRLPWRRPQHTPLRGQATEEGCQVGPRPLKIDGRWICV
jgi:hypothetical protein